MTGKYKDPVGQKAYRLSAELIYVKITETAYVSDELYHLLKEEEDGQIVSLGDSRIKRIWDRIAFLSMLAVRVVVLEYSQLGL